MPCQSRPFPVYEVGSAAQTTEKRVAAGTPPCEPGVGAKTQMQLPSKRKREENKPYIHYKSRGLGLED